MVQLEKPLANRLKQLRVQVDSTDDDTLMLKQVPVLAARFSKTHTNLLVKRMQPGGPFVLGVDEDLEYTGSDADLLRAFAGSVRRQGWRILLLTERLLPDAQGMVQVGLQLLGSDGQEPHLPLPASKQVGERKLLATLGKNLSELARLGQCEPTVGREDEAIDLVAAALRWSHARLPLVLGESGVGKTNLLHAAARQLLTCRPQVQLVRLDAAVLLAGTIFDAERENLLDRLFKETLTQSETILAIEHLELLLFGYGPLQLTHALDAGVKLIGTTLSGHLARFKVHPLLRRLYLMELTEPTPEATMAILAALCPVLAQHHRLEIDQRCIPGAVQSSEPLPGWFPAKAIGLLDAAASRASVAGAKVLALDDIYTAASLCAMQEDG
jgi:ATP-dependent Clp protease ATP-binding subunit ClpA